MLKITVEGLECTGFCAITATLSGHTPLPKALPLETLTWIPQVQEGLWELLHYTGFSHKDDTEIS